MINYHQKRVIVDTPKIFKHTCVKTKYDNKKLVYGHSLQKKNFLHFVQIRANSSQIII